MNCVYHVANAIFLVSASVSFMQQVESAIRTMCSLYSTACILSLDCHWNFICASSHTHMLISIIIFPIAPCNKTFRPVPASACLCHLYVLCSPNACLLAWHLEPILMDMMSVQVCSESTGHAEAVQMTRDPGVFDADYHDICTSYSKHAHRKCCSVKPLQTLHFMSVASCCSNCI